MGGGEYLCFAHAATGVDTHPHDGTAFDALFFQRRWVNRLHGVDEHGRFKRRLGGAGGQQQGGEGGQEDFADHGLLNMDGWKGYLKNGKKVFALQKLRCARCNSIEAYALASQKLGLGCTKTSLSGSLSVCSVGLGQA